MRERGREKGRGGQRKASKVVIVMTGSDVADFTYSPRLCLRKSKVKNTISLWLSDRVM